VFSGTADDNLLVFHAAGACLLRKVAEMESQTERTTREEIVYFSLAIRPPAFDEETGTFLPA
jgi:hypothetical protein